MALPAHSKPHTDAPRTLIGWQGMRFSLPPEWNITGFSMDRREGYLKVDSPGTMFVQVKWTDTRAPKRRTLAELLFDLWRRFRKTPETEPKQPDLRAMLENFLKQTAKHARKQKATFDCRIKPETIEANGERAAHNFSWIGGGVGQGKIWHCRKCGRVVIAQVIGQPRDNISDVAAQMFGDIIDHAEQGWYTWALYDLVAQIPADFVLKTQKLMSGYLKLEFERRGEKIVLERWGLANITLKKFTLPEWFEQVCPLRNHRAATEETSVQGHLAVRATGRIRGVGSWVRALRGSLFTLNPPAIRYEAMLWECPESNKIYAIQLWRNLKTEGLLNEVVVRCECH